MAFDLRSRIPEIIAIVGAIICLLAIFMPWLSGNGISFNGSDIMSNRDGITGGMDSIAPFAPAVVLIAAFACAVVAVVRIIGVEISSNAADITFTVAGFVAIVFAVIFLLGNFDVNGSVYKMSDFVGTGVWASILGGVVLAINGALGLTGAYAQLLAEDESEEGEESSESDESQEPPENGM